jgi:hypothetical protein
MDRLRTGSVAAFAVTAMVTAACGEDSATVTQAFTGRLAQVSDMRASVEARVDTLKQDCFEGTVPQDTYCYEGETFYADNVMGSFNAWITEVQGDLTSNGTLENVPAYDVDLQTALASAQAFNDWVDEVHRYFVQGGTAGANAAPSVEEIAGIAVDAGVAVWEQYRQGQDVRVDRLNDDIEGERFRAYRDI